jgi:hypothetical protein
MTTTAVSGATGTVCMKNGLYKATDNKAQYIELIAAGATFPPLPGGKGTKSTTWYLVQQTTTTVTGEGGTVTMTRDGGFSSVLVPAGPE